MEYIDSWIEQSVREGELLSTQQKQGTIYSQTDLVEFARLHVQENPELTESFEAVDSEHASVFKSPKEDESDSDSSYIFAYGEIKNSEKGAFKDSLLKESNKTLPMKGLTNDTSINNQLNMTNLKRIFDDFKLSADLKLKSPLPLSSKLRGIVDSTFATLKRQRKGCDSVSFADDEESDQVMFDMDMEEFKDTKSNTKHRSISNNSANSSSVISQCRPLLPDNILDDVDGEISFYDDIFSLEDKSWLPRQFQNHKLNLSKFCNKNQSYIYYKNKKCPSSSCGPDDPHKELTGEELKNLTIYRYSRNLRFYEFARPIKDENDEIKTEVMCRMCRGVNWMNKDQFSTHLSLSHGILSSPKCKKISLMPLPRSLLKSKKGRFTDYHANCGECGEWMALGNLPTDSYNVRNRNLGLYTRYFVHYLKKHKDVLSSQ